MIPNWTAPHTALLKNVCPNLSDWWQKWSHEVIRPSRLNVTCRRKLRSPDGEEIETDLLTFLYSEGSLTLVVSVIEQNGQVVILDVYPFRSSGEKQAFRYESFSADRNFMDNSISGSIGGMPVSFFDPLFVRNRRWYGKEYNFNVNLSALALSPVCRAVVRPPIKADLPDETGTPVETEIKLDLLRMLLPAEAGSNLVRYRAKVNAVSEFSFCGQPMLDLALDAGDLDDGLLILYLTVHRSACDQVKSGEFIEGTAWLHGFVADTYIHFDF
jgi:hypothetical protein